MASKKVEHVLKLMLEKDIGLLVGRANAAAAQE